MTRDTSTISDLTLEQYHLAELPADESARVSFRAATDPEVRARLAAIVESDAGIRAQYSHDWLAGAVADRIARERSGARARRPGTALIVMASAAVVLACVVTWSSTSRWPWAASSRSSAVATADPDRVKGDDASLMLYRRSGSSGERLADGDAARRGDLVRVAYRCASQRFGAIVSIDGRGVVTRHLPVDGDAAAVLQTGSTVLLDEAYELDDAPRWERFFLITGETAFDVRVVIDAAQSAAAQSGGDPPASLPLRADLQQSSFLLRKIS